MTTWLCTLVAIGLLPVATYSSYADDFNRLQELLRYKDEILGEGSYECYANGECVMEYSYDNLMTYREEPLCARSPEGCGPSMKQVEKRQVLCTRLEEHMAGCIPDCDIEMIQAHEEAECEFLLAERKARKRREACAVTLERFEELCGVGEGRKRAISDECSELLQNAEELGCEAVDLQKRGAGGKKKGCPAGWAKLKKSCYKYFPGPLKYDQARAQCASVRKDGSARLATLEKSLINERRTFFNNLVESSGAIDKIDSVLSKLPSHYNNGNWKDMIQYFDNWAWIGVRKIGDEWRWADESKSNPNDWTVVKNPFNDWVNNPKFRQPTVEGGSPLRMDYGNCVSYFNNAAEEQDFGGWWNVACTVQLPFLCEADYSYSD